MRCPICHELMYEINSNHTKRHGMTMLEFAERYPEIKLTLFRIQKTDSSTWIVDRRGRCRHAG